ncbi:UDP-N-acetylglucosamine transporter YEA4 [Sparassis crispa]|uniref:UDP-N-acetylglucosamine transporter YEA4 n=1 Tax=Sparassis crispa TaxID=139825 RepID=A0A401GWB5_9APHY|nr:UDP-N-acetylglucosamine transporter YEA4 [Sparassis crispa]GBE86515.1 UDP-N-acetylglucosamine transporter YEA4 [Sparassis crispa]
MAVKNRGIGHRHGSRLSSTNTGVQMPTRRQPKAPQEGNGTVSKAIVGSIIDLPFVLSLVFGGCCANVWSYEHLLKIDARLGTALTFSQMCFITLHSLPSFLTWPANSPFPHLKPRRVPLRKWVAQVLLLTSSSLLNNWAFAYHVPLTVQIVFRSAGLAISMVFGYLFLRKRYSVPQIAAVAFVSVGVITATLSRPSTTASSGGSASGFSKYSLGVCMLVISLFLTGALGLLQEKTYKQYGPCWQEGVFYTHSLSLPIFLFLIPDVKYGYQTLSTAPASLTPASILASATPYLVLMANLFTQLVCVSGVNQLTSRVTSVTTNLALTARKALSLCFSVWWFGSGWNAQLGAGAGMVFLGSLLYTVVSTS